MAFFFFFVFFVFATVVAASIAAGVSGAITRRLRPAVIMFFGVLVLGGAAYVLLIFLSDQFVRHSVVAESVTGSYALNESSRGELQELGYGDFSARMEVKSDGTLTGSRIPFCCLTGQGDERERSHVAYYDLTGKWELVESSNGIPAIQMIKPEATPSNSERRDPWTPPRDLEFLVMKGKPTGLSVMVFMSGDDHYISFSR